MTLEEITFPVIKVNQPVGDFFLGTISPRELAAISYSDVRRIEGEQREVEKYLGIQRDLDKSRVKKIKQYIQSPDASFPTGIVLAIDQKCAEYDQENGKLIIKPYTPPAVENEEEEEEQAKPITLDKIAKVLDGQHRIAAFLDDKHQYDTSLDITTDFELNIVVFIGLDIDEQANIFATINLAQTKVNRSLVYDLEGLSKTRSPFRTCHKIAVTLDTAVQSPLYKRIKRLGVKTKGRDTAEPLTQAVFVESLIGLISPDPFADRTTYMKNKTPKKSDSIELKKFPFRNMFIEEKDDDIAIILYNYFSSVRNLWPTAWNGIQTQGNILPRSNAFKALMRFLKVSYLSIVDENIGNIPTIEQFQSVFSNLQVEDNEFTSGNFKPGSGGESAFFKLLTGKVTINDLKEQ
ncbi:DGQHR domain-containing protein [Flavobacterium anhuiense]|uniref:DGQHR domain-containing protein n=1 Tax=Flavobacterium anhuiense TaxID=459526 RepID=UPI0034D97A81